MLEDELNLKERLHDEDKDDIEFVEELVDVDVMISVVVDELGEVPDDELASDEVVVKEQEDEDEIEVVEDVVDVDVDVSSSVVVVELDEMLDNVLASYEDAKEVLAELVDDA